MWYRYNCIVLHLKLAFEGKPNADVAQDEIEFDTPALNCIYKQNIRSLIS